MASEIKVVDCMDNQIWSDFVGKNPQGNIFQTPEMVQVYEKTKRIKPVTLFAVEDGKINSMLVAYISKEKEHLGGLASRAVIQGGPLSIEGDAGVDSALLLIDHYDNLVKKKVLFTEIRMLYDVPQFMALGNKGYVREDHLNFILDLRKPTEVLWNQLKKSRRYGIKRALEKKVVVEEVKDEHNLKVFYHLLKKTYNRVKLPLADTSLFNSVFNILSPKSMAKFYLAKHNREHIGGILLLTYGGVVYYWYACSDQRYFSLYPNDLLLWHGIEWGSKNNYVTFDFGGAGRLGEKYGVREFKKKFGGQMVNYCRYKKVYSHLKMKIAEKGFEIHRRLFIG